ncbi:hypothetical protein GCM10010172_62370 [Paractinoplanes ferrugineus]|uniref:Uncharacterized protein n=1 Tax=Paractinoplanes ferrugineus TaxID=113564 RepID=A0A919J854_9ACTN|nr:hypothetical protein Afe05nite_84410 [Actinoplanes ferrugineus]
MTLWDCPGTAPISGVARQRLDQESFAAVPPERRARHYLNITHAHTQIGNIEKASKMLLEGDRLAPSEMRCGLLAHEVLADLLRRTRGTPPTPIAELVRTDGRKRAGQPHR